ncbi:helix-turn-helix transcriptional regulator [Isoptericola croceus]|uniref:helix-turn-helix transcriptional regulator n=1 Tax=Isoptericola croceus TaxID=3031406 RepID=UPI0023F6CFD2|nr:helix-turn-helix transcriptional regulator [Isoptericola croceus]
MDDARRAVTLVTPENATLGHALGAALTSRGWAVHEVRSDGILHDLGPHALVVLVEDDQGRCPPRQPVVGTLRRVIGIGSVRSLPVLERMQRHGAVVLNQAAPMLTLLHHVETAVTRPLSSEEIVTAAALRRRVVENECLTLLTAAEDAVLRAMLAGAGAVQIGVHRHLSIHTVRSHIKGVLAKLDVRSQLEAVAVARRAGRMDWLFDATVRFTNSGEDDRLGVRAG